MNEFEKKLKSAATDWATENHWMNHANCYREEAFEAGAKWAQESLKYENARLRDALEFYARYWENTFPDLPAIAREALKGGE